MKKLNLKPYIEKAKELKITPFQLTYSNATSTTVSTFNGKVESQEIGNDSALSAKGIFKGKLGAYGVDAITSKTVEELVNGVYEACKYGKDDSKDSFFDGKNAKYKKVKIKYADFEKATLSDLRKLALDLDKIISKKDKRITKVEISISMVEGLSQKENDLGLKCSSKSAAYFGYMSIVAEDNGEPRSSGASFKSFKNMTELKEEALKKIDDLVSLAVDFFKSGPVKSKLYPVVLSPDAASALFSFYIGQLSAKNVIEHLSVFENKLNEQICSKKLSVTHTPFEASTAASSYDKEGVPTKEFKVIKNGVLLSYFHSLETSKKMKVEDNGCGSGNGTASPIILTIKKGTKTKEEGFSKIKNGIYLTEVNGLNSGINSQTLEFSLPCQGYQIIDGKKDKAVSMILISGNLKDVFSNVKEVYNDVEDKGGIFTPSMLISKLAVSGK